MPTPNDSLESYLETSLGQELSVLRYLVGNEEPKARILGVIGRVDLLVDAIHNKDRVDWDFNTRSATYLRRNGKVEKLAIHT